MSELDDVFGTTASIIKQWRKQRGLSQAALAAELDISTRHLSFIECEKSKPSKALLEKIIRTLKIPKMQASQLLMLTGYSDLKQSVKKISNDPPKERGPDWLLDFMLDRFSPFVAFVHDEYSNFVRGNKPFDLAMSNFPYTPYLVDGKINALLTVAHPLGLRPYLENWQSVFQQMYWRFERKAKAHPEDPKFQQIMEELNKIPEIPELLKSRMSEDVLHGIGDIRLEFGDDLLQFTRVTTDFQGPLMADYSRHYHMVAFLPSNKATADICKENLSGIFVDADQLKRIAQKLKHRPH